MIINPIEILQDVTGYKGLPFPGAWVSGKFDRGGYTGEDFETETDPEPMKEYSNKGTALYKKDLQGNYYFMPVVFMHNGKVYEITCAVVSITGKKNIVSTPMIGRKGTVKELINEDDYQINITGIVIGENQQFPEAELDLIKELYSVNEAVELKCALTDVFLTEGDKVVITDISFPQSVQTEYTQVIEMQCISDRAFELILS